MKNYEFYVPGIRCATNCKPAIERVLLDTDGVHNYTVDVTRKRVSVTVNDNITPQTIIRTIQKAGTKYQATLITEKENQIFDFGVTGIMLTTRDCRHIEEAMGQHGDWPDIQSCTVNYATNVVRIKMVAPIRDPNRFQAVQTGLQAAIKGSMQKKMNVDIIPPPLSEGSGEAATHFRKALINLGVLLLLVAGGGLLPVPVMGLITLGSMWVTAKETYIDAYKEAKKFSATMDTLIALGTITALLSSVLAISQSFAAIPMILGIIKLGQSVKTRAQEATAKEIKSSYQLKVDMLPYDAVQLDPTVLNEIRHANPEGVGRIIKRIIQEDWREKANVVKASEVKKGTLLLVQETKRVPADGIVFCDEALVRQEAITGESTPCNVTTESEVKCGSYVVKNSIIVYATADGKESWLNNMLSKVKNSASKEPPHPELINRFAKWFTPFILGVAMLSGLGWLYLGGLSQAMQVMSAVLLCACPCMIGLGGPIAYASAIYKAFKEGVIVKNTAMLDAMGKIDELYVDKTGTVTDLQIESVFIEPSCCNAWTEKSIVERAAAVQQFRTHQSFTEAFANKNNHNKGSLLECEHFESNQQGVVGTVEGKRIIVGEKTFLLQKNIRIPKVCSDKENEYLDQKRTVTYIGVDGKCVAVVASKHVPRQGAKEMIEAMQNRGINVSMLTGDEEGPAKEIAEQIGIASGRVYCKLKAEDKARLVKDAKARGKRVLLLGDGTNDQAAMKEADVAIAMGTSANAASSEEAGMVVTCLSRVPKIEIIAKETLSTVAQNYGWTFAYNFFTLIAATGLLYPLTGIMLTPVLASLLMATSSLFIVLNTSRLQTNIDIALGARAPLSFWQHVKSFFSPTALCRMVAMFIGRELKENPVVEIAALPPVRKAHPQPCPPVAVVNLLELSPEKQKIPDRRSEQNRSPSTARRKLLL